MDNKIKELLQKIIVKAYEVNANTEHDVFVWFSGHTNDMDISYHKQGWNEDSSTKVDLGTIYLDRTDACERLEFALEQLKKLEVKDA